MNTSTTRPTTLKLHTAPEPIATGQLGGDTAQAQAPASLIERILSEGAIGFAVASTVFGKFNGDKPTNTCTLTRWAAKGIRLADGSTLRLEAGKICGRMVTSRPAIVRFLERQQPDQHADA